MKKKHERKREIAVLNATRLGDVRGGASAPVTDWITQTLAVGDGVGTTPS